MRTEIIHCDLCSKAVKGPGCHLPVNGAIVEFGTSVGGFGYRQTPVSFSGEICHECYKEFEIILGGVQKWLASRGGIRAPEIIISEREVSTVWSDEPPSQGHRKPVLRQLPHFLGK